MTIINLTEIDTSKSEAYLEKTKAVALFIEDTACELGVSKLMNGKYRIRSYQTSGGNSYDDLELDCTDEFNNTYVSLSTVEVSSGREQDCRNGDLRASYNRPTREDIDTFVNDIPELLAELEARSLPDSTTLDRLLRETNKTK